MMKESKYIRMVGLGNLSSSGYHKFRSVALGSSGYCTAYLSS